MKSSHFGSRRKGFERAFSLGVRGLSGTVHRSIKLPDDHSAVAGGCGRLFGRGWKTGQRVLWVGARLWPQYTLSVDGTGRLEGACTREEATILFLPSVLRGRAVPASLS